MPPPTRTGRSTTVEVSQQPSVSGVDTPYHERPGQYYDNMPNLQPYFRHIPGQRLSPSTSPTSTVTPRCLGCQNSIGEKLVSYYEGEYPHHIHANMYPQRDALLGTKS